MTDKARRILIEIFVFAAVALIFVGPLVFVVAMSGKTITEAAEMGFGLPKEPQYWENFQTVLEASDLVVLRAVINSTLLTVFSIAILIVVSAMAGFILERKTSRSTQLFNGLVLVGLMIPPSVITTIWVLQGLGIYKTLAGLTFVEVAINFPFAVLLYRAFMVSIPRELDEAALLEGCGGYALFAKIIFPLLKPVSSTIIIVSAVNIFNDFVNPLYFLPGAKNVTAQLTLYTFLSRYATQWNLLFANVLILTIIPLVLFLIFNKKIVAGMVSGAIKS